MKDNKYELGEEESKIYSEVYKHIKPLKLGEYERHSFVTTVKLIKDGYELYSGDDLKDFEVNLSLILDRKLITDELLTKAIDVENEILGALCHEASIKMQELGYNGISHSIIDFNDDSTSATFYCN